MKKVFLVAACFASLAIVSCGGEKAAETTTDSSAMPAAEVAPAPATDSMATAMPDSAAMPAAEAAAPATEEKK